VTKLKGLAEKGVPYNQRKNIIDQVKNILSSISIAKVGETMQLLNFTTLILSTILPY